MGRAAMLAGSLINVGASTLSPESELDILCIERVACEKDGSRLVDNNPKARRGSFTSKSLHTCALDTYQAGFNSS